MKRVKAFIVLLMTILSATIVCGLNSFACKDIVVAGTDEQESFYLLKNTNEVEKNSTAVGSTSGYGTFNLAKENVTLTANALDGFQVVGWYVKNGANAQLLTETTSLDLNDDEIDDIDLTINYFDSNYVDGKMDRSTLTISKVYANLEIEPVFDYILYTLDLTDGSIADYFNVTGNKSAYKLNETANLTLTPKKILTFDSVLNNGSDSVNITTSPLSNVLTTTDSVEIEFDVLKANNQINKLTSNARELFKATISVTTDDGEKQNEIANMVMENCLFSYVAKVTNEDAIYVTSDGFTINCVENYSEVVGYQTYIYYNFSKLQNGTDKSKTFNNVFSDFTVEIEYISQTYSVDFIPLLKVGEVCTEIDLAVLSTKNLSRGESITDDLLTELLALNNTGYTFVGYKATLESETTNDLSSISLIDEIKPANKTIYMCFEYVNYDINLDVTSLSLTDGTNTYYPYRSIKLNIGNQTETINLTDLSNISVTLKAHMGDELKFTVTMNDGFEFVSLEANGTDALDFIVTKEYLDAHTTLDFNLTAKYKQYTLEYFIDVQNNGTKDDVYATISVENSISRNAGDEIEENITYSTIDGLTDKVVIIKLENLHKYDTIKLKADANELTIDQSYYVRGFTYNGSQFFEANNIQNAFKDLMVKENVIVKAICSAPQTALEVRYYVDGEIREDFGATASVKTGDESVGLNQYGSYDLEVGGEYVVKLGNIPFGYKIVGRELDVIGDSPIVDTNTLDSYSFTVSKGELHTLYFKFQTIQYKFSVLQYGAGFNGEKYDFDGNEYIELSVNNSTLTFDKPTGYYVKQIITSNASLETEDASVEGTIYSKDILSVLSQIADENEIVDISVNYEIKKYNITINFSGFFDDAYLPKITLKDINDATIDGVEYDYTTHVFKNVPYNSSVKLTIDDDIQIGYVHYGWGADNIVSTYGYTYQISNITSNKQATYFVKLITFAIELNLNNANAGNPKINDIATKTSSIKLHDETMKIFANPATSIGYSFESFTYSKFVQFVGSDAEFASIYNELYYFQFGKPYKNNSSTRDYGLRYFKKVAIENTSATLNIAEFSPLDFYFEDDWTISIDVNYAKAELSIINNIARNKEFQNNKIFYSNSTSLVDDNKIVSVVVKCNGLEISSNGTATVEDKITVELQLNKNFDFDFELSTGATKHFKVNLYGKMKIALTGVTSENYSATFEDKGDGKYVLSFDVADVITQAINDKQIIINYLLSFVNTGLLPISTNFHDENFYRNSVYTLTSKSTKSSKKTDIAYKSDTFSYLFGYTLVYKNNLDNWSLLDISKINVYSVKKYQNGTIEKGDLLETLGADDDSSEYGIYPIMKEGKFQIELCLLENVYIEFVIEPIVKVNGTVGDDEIVVTKTFKCDSDANGIAQQLTYSSNDESSVDIEYAYNVFGDLTIKYYVESNGSKTNTATSPINCGRYIAEIKFEAPNSSMSWLTNFKLSQKVVLKIVPMDITLTALSVPDDKKLSMIYGDSEKTVGLEYLQFEGADNFTLNCGTSYNLKLYCGNKYLTSTIDGVETRVSDGLKHANVSDGEYYNTTFFGFSINNSNFNLILPTDNQLTVLSCVKVEKRELSLSGLEVYNKIYDGTTKAYANTNSTTTKLVNVVSGDDVSIDFSKLILNFNSEAIGANKTLTIDATQALGGTTASNYKITTTSSAGFTIYPDKISTYVKDIGEVILYNNVAKIVDENDLSKTDFTKVDLIPLNATLHVSTVAYGTSAYYNLYKYFANKISSKTEFSVGYSIYYDVNGVSYSIPNDLELSFPNIKKLSSSTFLTDERYGDLTYEVKGDRICIKLSSIQDDDLNMIFFFNSKFPFKLWQIILIVSLIVLLIVAIAIILIVRRKRKRELFESLNEKI